LIRLQKGSIGKLAKLGAIARVQNSAWSAHLNVSIAPPWSVTASAISSQLRTIGDGI
jgi:hypothetical protein